MVRYSSLDYSITGQIDRLNLVLRRAENGVIVLLECNSLPLREEVINRLKEELDENFKFLSINIDEKNKNLPGIVQDYSGSGRIDKKTVVFVHNIDDAMPEVIGYLNWGREVFLDLKVKIIILCPTFVADEIIKNAPDFYRFSHRITIKEKTQTRGEVIPSFISDVKYKDLNELNERINIQEHLLKKATEDYKIADLSFNLGRLYFKKNEYKNSLKFFNDCLKIYEKIGGKKQIAATYNEMGIIHYSQGNYSEALKWYKKSMEISEKIGNITILTTTYNNIGEVRRVQGNYSEALEWYNKSMEIKEKIGDTAGLVATYNNIGLIHNSQGNYPEALEWYNKGMEIMEKIGDTAGLAATYNNIGSIHDAQGNYTGALKWYNKSIEISDKLGMLHYSAMGYSNMGIACLENKDINSALNYFTKSRDLFRKLGLDKDADKAEKTISDLTTGNKT
ncbi:hypothetical protein BEH94_10820 [Candidatus Altiarchaeales archaeon WOR_SM1_SCG]|nr:hypothetical protein BEH94_10820 [Candidatus Altiarchaeales archaeon WOR_SM1_SCG]